MSKPSPALPTPTQQVAFDFGLQAITSTAPFQAWPIEARKVLAAAATVVRFLRGAQLATHGETMTSLLPIAEGGACSRLTAYNGKQFTIIAALKGWVFGPMPLMDGGGLPHDLVAAEDCTVIKLPFATVVNGKKQLRDRELLRMVGMHAEQKRLNVVRNSNHFRADFQPVASHVLVAKAAGPPGR